MNIKQYHIYLADLEPSFGAEPGKIRPVVTIQTDMLNDIEHPSTVICPLTTQLIDEEEAFPLRIYLHRHQTGLKCDSDILVDQMRAIDNRRFIKKIGKLNARQKEKLRRNLSIILFE